MWLKIPTFALTALAALFAGSARAQCTTASGVNGTTIVNCAGSVSVLQTDRSGVTTGMIGGQPFIGREAVPGVTTGVLGGAPYTLQGGTAPEPRSFLPAPRIDAPPTPTIALPPLNQASPWPLGSTNDPATKAAAKRRAEYLKASRDAAKAASKEP
ncbi:MAG: hypothetical protein ABIO37_13765 [Caulobacteraceae bacterium]